MEELIPIVAIATGALVAVAAIALRGLKMWVDRPVAGGGSGVDLHRIEELEERVAELEERADFSERLLSDRRHGDPGSSGG